ncbi:C-Myc-binding protein [Dorcoceras hygrometricum]|uniref:c-Myc-binding protein n=1 Tax=Dorcoceras hygrometricum TaxID=472368 RepID=A0A2Z7AQP0_9LAMI|nr:C-Myc-binding protein [Dorcoceras hygrometricum]
MEKEAKKEAFRKYLESSGVLDALTKGLVALYEQNDKPSSAVEFIQQKLGGPTVAEHEKLLAEISDLQRRYDELFATHQEVCRQFEEFKHTQSHASSSESAEAEFPLDSTAKDC